MIGAFFLLGTSIFPLAFALGLAAKTSTQWIGSLGWAIDALSVSLSLAAAAILAFSLTLTQQLEGREKLTSWRAAATAVGLTSVLGLVAGLLLAWPWSSLLFLVALIDTAVLVWIAIVCRFRWTHAGAIVTGAVACLTGYHLFAGHLPWRMPAEPAMMIYTIFGGTSAAVLVVFSGLLAATAAWFTKERRIEDAKIYAYGTAAVAVISLVGSAAAAWFEGGTSIPLAVFVFTIYGLACLIGNRWLRLLAVTHTGLALLVAATLWGLYWFVPTPTPLWAAILGIEALALALVGLALGQLQKGTSEQPNNISTTLIDAYRIPALDVADALAGLTLVVSALILLPDLTRFTHTAWPAIALTAAAGTWLLGAWTRDSRERTWIASATILLMLVHTFVYCLPDWLYQPWLDAVLLHATFGVAATLACQLGFRTSAPAFRDRLHRIFLEPISQSAGLSSALALPLLFVNTWEHMLTLSLCLFWLSAIWLVVAAVNRLPALITGAQAVMCLASVAAATAWLQQCLWSIEGRVDLTDLRTWQVYGLALAILALVWTITPRRPAKVQTRQQPPRTRMAQPRPPPRRRPVHAPTPCGRRSNTTSRRLRTRLRNRQSRKHAPGSRRLTRQLAPPAYLGSLLHRRSLELLARTPTPGSPRRPRHPAMAHRRHLGPEHRCRLRTPLGSCQYPRHRNRRRLPPPTARRLG